MVLHYTTDLYVALMSQETQQYTHKVREEEDCKLVNMNVNNAGSKKNIGKRLDDEGNVFTFVRPQRCTQCVFVSNL